jgi:hypothetical protein
LKTLYPLKPKVATNSDFYVFDTETGNKEIQPDGSIKITWELEATQKKFIFGVVYGLNYTKVIHSLKEMQDEFKNKRYEKKKVYAHNFGRFDGSVLFDNIFELDDESIFIGSRFISCNNGVCTFGDSLNIYKASIKEIGEKLDLKKLGMDDGNYKVSYWPKDQARDEQGCIRDCQILWDALFEIFEKAGDIKLTIGSLAMSYFRRFSMSYFIQANDNIKHFWHSYYGGRTEAFQMGATHSQVIDVNSLYPDRMRNIIFPNPKFLKYELLKDVKYFLKHILEHFEGCAQVRVNHPDYFIGLLPCRIEGKLCFPIGEFSGCYNFNEIRFALKYGVEIIGIEWVCYSERMPSPFEKFVDKLMLDKFLAQAEGRKLDEWVSKQLSVNLYGKFAQRIDKKTIFIKDVVDQYDLILQHQRQKTFIKLIPISKNNPSAFLIVKELKKKEISYSMPSFSSYITSAGRVKLGEKLIEMRENNPVYCDTDSVFFEIDNGVQSSFVLGEWKIEDKIITEINGLKNYKYISKDKLYSRIKGVPKVGTKEEIENGKARAFEVSHNEFEFVSLVGTKEGLRRNLQIGTPLKRTKKVKGTYEKRIVDKQTGKTKPIKL